MLYKNFERTSAKLKLVQFDVEQDEWAELSFINLTSYWVT